MLTKKDGTFDGVSGSNDSVACNNRSKLKLISIPAAITLLGLHMGVLSLWFAHKGLWYYVFACLLLAAIMDFLDGFCARKLGVASRFGAILDSITDAFVSVILPVLCLLLLLEDSVHGWLWVLVVFACTCYVCSGVVRLSIISLAVDHVSDIYAKAPHPGFYKGMPVPSACLAVLTSMIFIIETQANINWIVFVVVVPILLLSAVLMQLYSFKYHGMNYAFLQHKRVLIAGILFMCLLLIVQIVVLEHILLWWYMVAAGLMQACWAMYKCLSQEKSGL